MSDSHLNISKKINDTTINIVAEADLLGDGTNRDIFDNIDRLSIFQEKVYSVLHTTNQDWALRTVLDIFPNTHAAAVDFLKSSQKGQEIYSNISIFIKKCFMDMLLTNDNLNIYRSLLSFYYSEKTTIVMLPKHRLEFYHKEFDVCKKNYDKIDLLESKIDKLRIAYQMIEIVSKIKTNISRHMITQKIQQINNEGNLNKNNKKNEKQYGQMNRSTDESNIRLFISHSSKDLKLVELLVSLLHLALTLPASQIRCTSIDGYRFPAGANTDEQLRQEVHSADAFVGIISYESLKSLYVAFELGARWGANRPLLPVLSPGTDANILSGPLSGLNALNAGNPAQLHQLVSDLSHILKIPHETPAVYEQQIESIVSLNNEQLQNASNSKSFNYEDLSEKEIQILQLIAERGNNSLQVNQITKRIGGSNTQTEYYIDQLLAIDFIHDTLAMGSPTTYGMKKKGRAYLVERGLI